MNTNQIPIEQTLDPGEAVLPSSAVDTMTSIISLGNTEMNSSNDVGIASLVISAIVIYFIIKLILRFLPFVLGVGVIVILLTML